MSFASNLKNKDFMLLWFAQLVSQFGDRIHHMALVGLVAAKDPGSVKSLASIMAFTILPVFFVGPIAGVFVDRWDRRTILFVSDVIRGCLVLLIPFVFFYQESMWPIYGVVLCVFCFSRFYVPAKMAIVPDLVENKHLHAANSMISVTGMIAAVVGLSIGGFLVEWFGARGGFIIDAGTFLLSAFLVFLIGYRPQIKIDPREVIKTSKEILEIEKTVWNEIVSGLKYINQDKDIKFVISIMTLLFTAVGAIYANIIVFVQQMFGSVTKDVGILAIALGAGLFIGSMIYGKLGKKVSAFKAIFCSLIASGIMLAVFTWGISVTKSLIVGLGLAAVLGVVVGPIMVAANTLYHQLCSDEMRGKVFSSMEFIAHAGFIFALLVSAHFAEIVGVPVILMIVSTVFAGVGVFGLVVVNK